MAIGNVVFLPQLDGMQSIREVKGIAVIFAHRIPLAVIGIPMRRPTSSLSALDPLQFLVERLLDFFRSSFASGYPADVRTINAEFLGYPAIQPSIQLVSLDLRLFVMIRRHQW
jgi:hypothetical protein